MKQRSKTCRLLIATTLILFSATCESRRVSREEITRILEYLEYYPTFKIQLVKTRKDTLFLTRPYEKGRIVPIPGIWDDYLNADEWVDASKLVDTYIADIESVIECISGVRAIVWQVDSSKVPGLYSFRSPAYTLHRFIASLKYGDRLGFQECFADSLKARFTKQEIDIYDELNRYIQPAGKFLGLRVVNDSTFAIPAAQEGNELLLQMARHNDRWKISYFERTSGGE